jgi:hypothetical protein
MTKKNFFLRNVAAIVACLALVMFSGCDPEDLLSGDKQIVAFGFVLPPATGVIDESAKTIAVAVPAGTNVTTLVPAIGVSPEATVSPASGAVQDFTSPVQYTVTAANGTAAVYTVTVTVGAVPGVEPQELTSPITINTTLKDLGLPIDYVFKGSELKVTNNAILTVEPGVAIQFTNASGYLNMESGTKIVAVGTVEKHIQFVGSTGNKGAWRGIVIASVTENVLDYVEILNAGGQNYDHSAALYLNNGKVSVTNSLIDRSSRQGITIEGRSGNQAAELVAFSNNTVSNSDKAPIYTYSYCASYSLQNLANNNTFTGSTNAYIHISQSMNTNIQADMTLHHLNGYPWYFEDGLSIDADRNVTIEPGAVVLIGAQERIYVPSSSHLIAEGTAQSRIIIKGMQNNAGYWNGIEVSSQTPGTKFDYCDISGAGATQGTPADNGLIEYSANSFVEIYNCNLSKSLNSGVVCKYSSPSFNVHYNANLKQANVTFSEITGAIFRISEPDVQNLGALPTMSGNSWWQF